MTTNQRIIESSEKFQFFKNKQANTGQNLVGILKQLMMR